MHRAMLKNFSDRNIQKKKLAEPTHHGRMYPPLSITPLAEASLVPPPVLPPSPSPGPTSGPASRSRPLVMHLGPALLSSFPSTHLLPLQAIPLTLSMASTQRAEKDRYRPVCAWKSHTQWFDTLSSLFGGCLVHASVGKREVSSPLTSIWCCPSTIQHC